MTHSHSEPGASAGRTEPPPRDPEALARMLRLIVITDRAMAAPRTVNDVVRQALEAGARAVQLRDKGVTARELLETARALRELTREVGALLFVNDRMDVALAAGADGVHLGPDDIPVAPARRAAPPGFLIGYSTDDPRQAREAQADGADYIGCGTVYATASKADAGEVIGPAGLGRVVEAVSIPVVGIGGITPQQAAEVSRVGADGIAAIGAVMAADDPGEAARGFLSAFP